MTGQWYRMHDAEPAGVFPIERAEARDWNARGFGIFATVNSFDGPRRREHLTRINAWAVDMDEGSKESMHRRIHSAPLVPSLVVETKRGYQVYWIAKDGKPEHWNAIVLERLVPHFGADKNARDLCRILRVPGFLHLKDPADPFLVQQRWRLDVSYSERQIAAAFRWQPDPRAVVAPAARLTPALRVVDAGGQPTGTLWDVIYELDCEEGLARLSGHSAVGCETYTFKRTSAGRLNIYVNGKGSPCFIDENKRIGSPSGGGPTLAQWLRWFGAPWTTVIAVLKEVFPQLEEIDRAARAAHRRAA